MSAGGLVLTYHAIEEGPAPLCVPPDTFERHVEALVEAGAAFLTVAEVADGLRSASLPDRAVAVTFDDGCASVLDRAAPVLDRYALRATVFAVTGHLGGANDWPGQARGTPSFSLLGAEGVPALAGRGWEIGSHTVTHPSLRALESPGIERELRESRAALEALTGAPVTSFAFPYGVVSPGAADALAAAGYRAACGTALGRLVARSDPMRLPRVDAHYLRRPERLRAALTGETAYLRVRRAGARARRLFVSAGPRR